MVIVVEAAVEVKEILVKGVIDVVDIAVEGVGIKLMSDVLVVVVEALFLSVVEEVFGIVLVIVVEVAVEDKESVGMGVKEVSVECVSDMQKDSKPPASKQMTVFGNFSGLAYVQSFLQFISRAAGSLPRKV